MTPIPALSPNRGSLEQTQTQQFLTKDADENAGHGNALNAPDSVTGNPFSDDRVDDSDAITPYTRHPRPSASMDSRDLAALSPTEPNTSMTSFTAGNRGNNFSSSPNALVGTMSNTSHYDGSHQHPDYPYQSGAAGHPLRQTYTETSTIHSATNALGLHGSGVVGIAGRPSHDADARSYASSTVRSWDRDVNAHIYPARVPSGSSHHQQPHYPIPHQQPPHLKKIGSQVSQSSLRSVRSTNSFSRPGPVPGTQSRPGTSQSQASFMAQLQAQQHAQQMAEEKERAAKASLEEEREEVGRGFGPAY